MSEGRVWRRGSAILALSLLVMILMRLVWVQARHYEPLGMGQYNLATALAPEGCALLDPQEGKGTRPALERSSTGTGFWMTKDAARHLWVRFSCRNHVFRADLAAIYGRTSFTNSFYADQAGIPYPESARQAGWDLLLSISYRLGK